MAEKNEVFFDSKVASLEKNSIQDSINIMYCKVLRKNYEHSFSFSVILTLSFAVS